MEKREEENTKGQYLGVWIDESNCEIYGNKEAFKAIAKDIELALAEDRDFIQIDAKAFKKELQGQIRELREITAMEFISDVDEANGIDIVEDDWKIKYGCLAVMAIVLLLCSIGFLALVDFIAELL